MALFAEQVTLTGAVQTINFFDLYGLRVLSVGLLNMGSHDMQVSIGGAVPTGNALLLPQTSYMRIGNTGGVESITFQGTAADVLQIFATREPSDTLPDIVVFNPGGGGGGGSTTPSNADFVLATAFVGPGFTGTQTILDDLASAPLPIQQNASGGAGLVDMVRIAAMHAAAAAAGMGVRALLALKNLAGTRFDAAAIAARLVDGTAGAEVAELLLTSKTVAGATAETAVRGAQILLTNTVADREILVTGPVPALMRIGSDTDKLVLRGQGVDVVEVTNGYLQPPAGKGITIQSRPTFDMILLNGNGDAGIDISDNATRPITIVAGGAHQWCFRTDGDMEVAGKIKGLADGASGQQEAATVAQFCPLGVHIGAGSNTQSILMDPRFNGQRSVCSLLAAPGGPIAAVPVMFVAAVAAGLLKVDVIDQTTGAPLVGGLITACDVAVLTAAV